MATPDRNVYGCHCQAQFKVYEDLLKHRKTCDHSGPSYCLVCGMTFSRAFNLKSHQLSHKPATIRCPYCPTKVKRMTDLTRHRISCHSEDKGRIYKCFRCQSSFSRKDGRQRHLRSFCDKRVRLNADPNAVDDSPIDDDHTPTSDTSPDDVDEPMSPPMHDSDDAADPAIRSPDASSPATPTLVVAPKPPPPQLSAPTPPARDAPPQYGRHDLTTTRSRAAAAAAPPADRAMPKPDAAAQYAPHHPQYAPPPPQYAPAAPRQYAPAHPQAPPPRQPPQYGPVSHSHPPPPARKSTSAYPPIPSAESIRAAAAQASTNPSPVSYAPVDLRKPPSSPPVDREQQQRERELLEREHRERERERARELQMERQRAREREAERELHRAAELKLQRHRELERQAARELEGARDQEKPTYGPVPVSSPTTAAPATAAPAAAAARPVAVPAPSGWAAINKRH